MSREEVLACFGIPDDRSVPAKGKQLGRPPRHKWDAFWIEVCRRIHEEGIPETQAELATQMYDWFIGQRDESIDLRTIEKKISALFNVLRPEQP
jgi:hypothetical protein